MRRYFAINKRDNYLILSDGDIHHLLNVLRFKHNQLLEVVYEQQLFLCSLQINEQVEILIQKELPYNNELQTKVNLIYALVKGEKFENVIQKSVELGVHKIIPFQAKRSVVKLDDKRALNRVERWNKIANEAAKQSKRNDLVVVEPITTLESLINYKSELNLLANENKAKSSENLLFSLLSKKVESITIVVGPEGGFDDQEIKYLEENGFLSVSLGKRILRTETAPLYLMSVISFMLERGSNDEI